MAYGVLKIYCEAQILPPVRMLEAARVAADKQHYLTCAHALFGRRRLICHGIGAQRVTVQVNYDFYARVLGKVLFYGFAASVIRACVTRVVEHLRIVDDVQAAVLKYLRKLGADADNIKVLIERSICAEVIVFVKPGRGVGFARMRVQNENLRLIRFEPYWASGAQYRVDVDIIAGGVFIDMPPDMVVGIIVGVTGAALCTGVSVAAAASVGQAVSCASSARETVFFISSPPSVRRYKANR